MPLDGVDELSRRRMLAMGTVASTLVAGCLGDDDGGEDVDTNDGDEEREPQQDDDPQEELRIPEHDEIEPGDFASWPDYWAWFPADDDLWSRRIGPYDFRHGDARWLAAPTADGSIRCRVEHDDGQGHAGFYGEIGPVGQIESITVESEIVTSDGGDQELLFGLYFDVDDDGSFFEWETDGERDAVVSLGNDVKGIGQFPAGESYTIDNDTTIALTAPFEEERVTLADLKTGEIDGVEDTTPVALQVSVLGSGPTNVEEAIVQTISTETGFSLFEPPAESWPMYSHDEFNSGNNSASYGPTEAVDVDWEFSTAGRVRSSPAVVNEMVFVGSDDGHLYAIDRDTGEKRWAFETGDQIRSSPAVFHNRVIVGSDDGTIYGLDIDTGDSVWQFETGDRVRAPPMVQVDAGAPEVDHIVAVGSEDGSMYVFKPGSGELIHSQATDGPIGVSTVVVDWEQDWEIIWGSGDGNRHYWIPTRAGDPELTSGLNPSTAAPMTYRPPPPSPGISYEFADAKNLVKGFVGEFDTEWQFEAGDDIRSSIALGNFVYVPSLNGTLYALDNTSGEPEWTFETGDKIATSPALAGEGVYFGSADGYQYGVDAETGDLLWAFETDGPVCSSPAVVEGTVYFGSDDGTVYALSEST